MPTVLMLLSNAYDPDPRVRQEALALTAADCRVHLLAWDRDLKHPAREDQEGIEVERVFLRSRHGRGTTQLVFYAWLYCKLLVRGFKASFDAVHCHDLDTLPLGWLLGVLKRKPVVYDVHESFTSMLDGSVHPLILGWLTRLENLLIRRVNLLITVGERLRAHLIARGARRTVVVGNWKRRIDFAKTADENASTRARLGIPSEALVVVCITQLLKDRKIGELLDAIDQSPGAHLIIGGRGVLEPFVREHARRNPRIHYVGHIGSKEIASYTCASNVVYYGFDPANPNARFSAPNKLFEALAAGRPLITGDFGEIADVVRKADCGFVLPEYNATQIQQALQALAAQPLRERLSQNALEFGLSSMNWEMGKEILTREYSSILGVPLTSAAQNLESAAMAAGGGR